MSAIVLNDRISEALSEAAMSFADHGIEFPLPWNCDLDDLELERFTALAEACRAYASCFDPPTLDEAGALIGEMFTALKAARLLVTEFGDRKTFELVETAIAKAKFVVS